MIEYLRIPKNKFWGWVASMLAIGLILGAGSTYAIGRMTASGETDELKAQLASQTAQAAAQAADLQGRLDSTAASLTALSQQYSQLKAQDDAKDQAAQTDDSAGSADDTTKKLEVLSRKVSPSTVATDGSVTLTAKVQGGADKVTMRIVGKSNGFDETFTLKKGSGNSSSRTWQKTVAAPKKRGTYTYYATAYRGEDSATMPGASPSSFEVE